TRVTCRANAPANTTTREAAHQTTISRRTASNSATAGRPGVSTATARSSMRMPRSKGEVECMADTPDLRPAAARNEVARAAETSVFERKCDRLVGDRCDVERQLAAPRADHDRRCICPVGTAVDRLDRAAADEVPGERVAEIV